MDDASLAELERWTALERIDVRGTAVTQEGLERLKAARRRPDADDQE